MSLPANLVADDLFIVKHNVQDIILCPEDKIRVITQVIHSGHAQARLTFNFENDAIRTFSASLNHERNYIPPHPIIVLPGDRLRVSPASGSNPYNIIGYWIYKEERVPQSVFETKLNEIKEALKMAAIEALREASLTTLVEEVSRELADGQASSALAKKIGTLIEEKVQEAIGKPNENPSDNNGSDKPEG